MEKEGKGFKTPLHHTCCLRFVVVACTYGRVHYFRLGKWGKGRFVLLLIFVPMKPKKWNNPRGTQTGTYGKWAVVYNMCCFWKEWNPQRDVQVCEMKLPFFTSHDFKIHNLLTIEILDKSIYWSHATKVAFMGSVQSSCRFLWYISLNICFRRTCYRDQLPLAPPPPPRYLWGISSTVEHLQPSDGGFISFPL